MAQPQDLRRVYYHIIDDVVAKIKPEFVQEGVDESVLNTIRQRWAQKLTERGIISEGDQDEAGKKDEETGQASNAPSRKRPHDGSGPATKQEVNYPQNQMQPGAAPLGVKQPQQAQLAGLPPQLLQGLQQQQPQQPQVGIHNAAGALAQVLAQAQNLPGGLQAALAGRPMQNLIQQQQQHGAPVSVPIQQLQNLQNLRAVLQQQQQLQGMQRMPAGMQLAGLAGLQQMQPMQAPGMPQTQMQAPMQQHAAQQQQQQMQPMQMMPGLPQMQALLQQQQQQQQLAQQQQQQQRYNIPQQDGSSDLPPTITEMAAAAGMSQERLRSIMPRRIVAALDAHAHGSISSSRNECNGSSSGEKQVTAAADQGLLAGSSGARTAAAAAAVRSRGSKQRRLRIPQVDGNGDENDEDEYDEEDFVGGDEDGEEAAADGEEEQEEEDDEDDEDITKLDDDLDAQEEADKEEIDNVGFALYEKVHRAKNRWRCNLRYGVFFINGKEYMFNKGNTDLLF